MYVIRSQSEHGYWSHSEGWVYDVASATKFDIAKGLMPMTVGNDARYIPVASAVDFPLEENVERISRQRVRSLKREEKVEIIRNGASIGYIKNKGRSSYCLNLYAVKERNRWGNLDQILKDYDHVMLTGALPPPQHNYSH